MDMNFTEEASKIWAMLDDMAANNPAAYRKFIDKQMEEGKVLMSKPEMFLLFQVETFKIPNIIVICAWERVKKAETDDDPLPMYSGDSVTTSKNSIHYVAVNPDICKRCGEESNESQEYRSALIHLSIKFLNETKKIHLSFNYKEISLSNSTDFDINESTMYESLHYDSSLTPQQILNSSSSTSFDKKSNSSITSSLADVLKAVKTTNNPSSDGDNDEPPLTLKLPTTLNLPPTPAAVAAGKSLIEEIKEPNDKESKQQELVECAILNDHLKTNIFLDEVKSVNEVTLDVSDTELLIESKKKKENRILFQFPKLVDSNSAKAKFNKKTHILTITVKIKI